MRQYSAGVNDVGVRLTRFVLRVTQNLPNTILYKSFRTGRIKVNGKKAGAETRLAQGDCIQLYLNDEFFPEGTPPILVESHVQQPHFGIVWEDDSVAVLYKPAGVLCHSDETKEPTLLSAFTHRLTIRGQYNSALENTFAPALCNRLDRGTEGLVLAAKNYPALRDLNELIRLNCIQKIYWCITAGTPPTGEFHAFLKRDKSSKIVSVSENAADTAKPIATKIQVLERKSNFSLCEITLLTGRTHQIRAHLAFLGAPILGDAKYGKPAVNKQTGFTRQALCARQFSFANELPPSSTLAYLAGKQFVAEQTKILQQWTALCF